MGLPIPLKRALQFPCRPDTNEARGRTSERCRSNGSASVVQPVQAVGIAVWDAVVLAVLLRVAASTYGDGQVGALGKRIFSNECDAIGDGDAGQAGTPVKCLTTNSRDAVGDGDAG